VLASAIAFTPSDAAADGSPWPAWTGVLASADDAVEAWSGLAGATMPPPSSGLEAGRRLAEALVARADYPRAIRVLGWVERRGATPRTRYLRGFSLQMSGGDVDEALACYVDAMPDPKCRFWAGAHRALLLADLGEPAAAAASLAEAQHGRDVLAPAAAALVDAIRARLADHEAAARASAGARA
jgi:hypothetical protein